MFGCRRGESKLSSIIYLLIAAGIFYFLYKMIPPYMDFFALEDEANHQLMMAKIVPEDVIFDDLYKKAMDREIPITKDDIELNVTNEGKMDVYIAWDAEVDFGYGIVKVLEFEIDVSNYNRGNGEDDEYDEEEE